VEKQKKRKLVKLLNKSLKEIHMLRRSKFHILRDVLKIKKRKF